MTAPGGGSAQSSDRAWAFEIAFALSFRDLDALGHVNHTAFLRYMEDARTAWYLDLSGLPAANQLDIIMAEVTCTYLAPANYRDRLRCGVRPVSLGRRSFVWRYGVWNEATGQMLATGRSVLVSYDYAANAPCPVPDWLRLACEPWLERG